MAPAVKQGVDEDFYRLNAKVTHAAVNGVPVWQTPSLDDFVAAYRQRYDTQDKRIAALRDEARTWKIAFLTVCAQFFVVCVAAVWGWAR